MWMFNFLHKVLIHDHIWVQVLVMQLQCFELSLHWHWRSDKKKKTTDKTFCHLHILQTIHDMFKFEIGNKLRLLLVVVCQCGFKTMQSIKFLYTKMPKSCINIIMLLHSLDIVFDLLNILAYKRAEGLVQEPTYSSIKSWILQHSLPL